MGISVTLTKRQRIKNHVEIYATCVYISAIIYLVEYITDLYTKYVMTIEDPLRQIGFTTIMIFFYGFLIFIAVIVSKRFRDLLFRAFGAEGSG